MNMGKNEIYNSNMKCIFESNPYLWETLQEQEEAEYDVFLDTSISGEKIVGINSNGKDWYFNSRYSAEKAAEVWTEGTEVQNYEAVIIVFGFSNGMYLKKLIENIRIILLLLMNRAWH